MATVKICLVLGAGASLANARFFRKERGLDTHPPLDTTFFQKLRVLDVPLNPSLRSYVRRLTGSDPNSVLLEGLRMEEFFKDVFYDFQDSPNDKSLRTAYIELVRMYTAVLRETTNWLCEDSRVGAPVGRLLAAAADSAAEVDVITFNHDLVIENEIFKRRRLRPRWCIEEGYGAIAAEMVLTRSGLPGGDFPRHGDDCDHERRIRVLKLHGSLNWVFRMRGRLPSASQLTGQRAPNDVFLTQRRQIPSRLRYTTRTTGRGRASWYTWPLIIPPIYAKQSFIHLIAPAWVEARQSLEGCDRMVFFGYSLPPADIEAEKLFQRAITANVDLAAIEVVNPDPLSPSRYATLAPRRPLRWYPDLDRYLAEKPFEQRG